MTSDVEVVSFERTGLIVSPELEGVRLLAGEVERQLNSDPINKNIKDAHVFNASSQKVQVVIEEMLCSFGFESEKKGLFDHYKVKALRPDYYKKEFGGVIFEVERGKTIANNMDLLDVWKAHICEEAKHLFLMVPRVRVNGNGRNAQIFNPVKSRIEAFFTKNGSHIDVDSVTIFGY
jgi:hypothetical protein